VYFLRTEITGEVSPAANSYF